METTTTEQTVDRNLVTGGDADALFNVPFFSGDFRDAPELKRIGDALIAACEEFEDLKWAIEEDGFEIAYVWRKKAAKSADRVKAGSLGKASGRAKHFASQAKGVPVGYIVEIAADTSYGQTNWQIEALVFHEIYHVKISRKTKGRGEDKVTVPVLKTRAHDLEMFWAERLRYGDWRYDLRRGQEVFAQTKLPIERPRTASLFDPAVDQSPGVESELGPVAGGAPAVDWAETFKDDPDMMDLIDAGLVVTGERQRFDMDGLLIDDEPNDDTHDPETGEDVDPDAILARIERVRENFGTYELGGITYCERCGQRAIDHDPDVCQGGTPETRKRRRKTPSDLGQIQGEATGANIVPPADCDPTLVLGQISASNGNGTHDRADVAGLLADPDRVTALLSEVGWKIAYQIVDGNDDGWYVNSESFQPYLTEEVESAYRHALAGLTRRS